MIAVCPACHDAIHHGEIEITDDTVYRWKAIDRQNLDVRDHVYIEPGERPRVVFGSFEIESGEKVVVVRMSPNSNIEFAIHGGVALVLDMVVSLHGGEEVIRVLNGHVIAKRSSGIEYRSVPGRITVTAPVSEDFVPEWAIRQIRQAEATFGLVDRFPLVDIEVTGLGCARVRGLWAERDRVVWVGDGIVFCGAAHDKPIAIYPYPRNSIVRLKVSGVINKSVFGFADEPSLLRLKNYDPSRK